MYYISIHVYIFELIAAAFPIFLAKHKDVSGGLRVLHGTVTKISRSKIKNHQKPGL